MTYEQANKGKENPKFGKEEGYRVNCQTCTVTHMLRRLGFDTEAKPNIRQSAYNEMAKQGITWEERFLNRDGTKPDYDYTYKWQVRKGYQVMNANRLKEYFRENSARTEYMRYIVPGKAVPHTCSVRRCPKGK